MAPPTAAVAPAPVSIFGAAHERSPPSARVAGPSLRRLSLIAADAPSLTTTLGDPAEIAASAAAQPRLDVSAQVAQAGPADAALLAVLGAPLADGESATDGFARKERELLAIAATLKPIDSLVLERRLAAALPTDPLTTAFTRLTVTRRTRFTTFLSTSRRRAQSR